MANSNTHKTGVIFVVVSAVVFSTAGIFTNGVDTAAWGVIFWRGLAAAGFTLCYLALRGQLMSEVRAFRGPALAVACLGAMGTAAFIPAFKLSSVANVALIYASAPFVAAALAWVCIKERPNMRIMLASAGSMLGVAIILRGSWGHGHIVGDMLALVMTFMMSGVMVVYRRYPETTAALPAALSSVLLLPIALAFGTPLNGPSGEIPILIAFGLVFAVASVTLQEGARRLPSAETALISTLEMPLAPLLAFLILAEQPTLNTILGGVIIFISVLWSQRKQGDLMHET